MQFCDLPTEILLQIVNEQCLNAEDLYGLATLSRLLNSISLPPYLRLNALHDPSSYCAIYIEKFGQTPRLLSRPALDGLSGLAISTKLTYIGHLVCYLRTSPPFDSDFLITERKLSQLCRVISRLEQISQFRLYLLGTFAPQFGRTIPDKNLQIWTSSIGGLLNTVVDRGCTELGVHSDDPYYFYSVNPSRKPNITIRYFLRSLLAGARSPGASLRGLSRVFRCPQDGKYPKVVAMQASPQSLATSALRSFKLQSQTLFTQPYLNWTLSVLSLGSNITALTFRLTQLEPELWKSVLTRVSEAMSNRLKEIYFQTGCYGLQFGDLLEFLSKTPNLTDLGVQGACKVEIPEPCAIDSLASHKCPFVVPHLPKLLMLTAPFSITSHLLSKCGAPDIPPLPRLRDWVVFFEGWKLFGNYAYVEDCYQRHAAIRERLLAGNSRRKSLRYLAHIDGRPYNYQMPLLPDEDKFAEAEGTGTLPQFLEITRVLYSHMPSRRDLLAGMESFFRAADLRFPEQREIRISEKTLDRMSNDITYGYGDDGNVGLKTTEEVLSLLKQRFGKLERLTTEKREYLLS